MSNAAANKLKAYTLTRQLQELSAQVQAQNHQVQKLLGTVVIWETMVLKPMVAQLHS